MFIRNGFGRRAGKSSQGNILIADSKGLRARIRPVEARMGAFLRSGEDGQALLEMWVVLPMLLILLTGVFTFGIAYTNKLTLTNGVGSAAQQLQVSRSTSTDPCGTAWSALVQAAPGLKPSQLSMTVTFNSAATGGGTTAGSLSTPGPASCTGSYLTTFQGTQGETNTVTAAYPCNLAIYGRSFASGCYIEAQVAAYEY
jgi:Flp pilus assembly protein TadG